MGGRGGKATTARATRYRLADRCIEHRAIFYYRMADTLKDFVWATLPLLAFNDTRNMGQVHAHDKRR